MTVASIDIGSNTVLLLIAKIDPVSKILQPLINLYRIPRISQGLNRERKINDQKIEELLIILSEFREIADSYKCDNIIAKATNAFRIALNSKSIIDLIQKELDILIDVISGEEEAKLSFLGAKSSFRDINDCFVLDIGGGSTELIVGNSKSMSFRKSFPWGAVNLTEKYPNEELLSGISLNDLFDFTGKAFNEIKELSKNKLPLIAVAGTPTTVSGMLKGLSEYDEDAIEGSRISSSSLTDLIQRLNKMTPEEVLSKYGSIVHGREDVILTGSVILNTILKKLNLRETLVSGRGVRYGAAIQFIEQLT